FVTTAAHSQRVYEPDGKTDIWEWSLWPDLPVFVPFMHTLINSLMHGQTEAYNVTAGEVLHWYPNDKTGSKNYTLVHPDGKSTQLGRHEKKGKRLEVPADDLPRAGVYRLVAHVIDDAVAAESAGIKDRGIPIAASPDLGETADLGNLSDGNIDELLGFAP